MDNFNLLLVDEREARLDEVRAVDQISTVLWGRWLGLCRFACAFKVGAQRRCQNHLQCELNVLT